MPFVYIARCSDDTLYTGTAVNLEKRIMTHNAGKGAKYTRGRIPLTVVFSEEFSTLGEAMKRESIIKKMSRNEKMRMAEMQGSGLII